ncbi:MAG: LysR substrate-binding domain-containing protein [Dongiaceae bacterium]
MSRRLPPLHWLRAFEAAARHTSFTEAARELNVTQSAVSQQVKRLEQRFGRPLFQRLPRGLRVTAAGEALLPLLTESFDRLSEGTEELFGRRRPGPLLVKATAGFAALWLAPRLPRLHRQHPDLALRLTTTIWTTDFVEEGVDLEIRSGFGRWPGLVAERLTWDSLFPVASPRANRAGGALAAPADLERHRLLHVLGFRDGWAQWHAAAGFARGPAMQPGDEFDTAILAYAAAEAGAGVALGRTCLVAGHLKSARLVSPFGPALETEEAYYLVHPARLALKPAAEAFRDWVLAEASAARER